MAENEEGTLWIITDVEGTGETGERRERGLREMLGGGQTSAVDTRKLKENMESFLENIREILSGARERIGHYHIEEVKISARITAGGKICLLGSGAQAYASGGIEFTLKRTKKPAPES
jgi:hypothetical protein